MNKFIGRTKELTELNRLLKKTSASIVVVTGRRRIGKSRLIQEFGKHFTFLSFSGIPPTSETSRQSQLAEFGWQLGEQLNQPPFRDNDWNDYFARLAAHTKEGRVIILLDEISWMGSKDSEFLGKLKNAWDKHFSQNPQLILVLCGSVSRWIEKNILSTTGFVGRISLRLKVEELPLKDANQFWGNALISPYEKFKILAITGGIPKYLEEIVPELPADQNIKNLCFTPSGFLFNEFDRIFSDLFDRRSKSYQMIVKQLIKGPSTYQKIWKSLGKAKGGLYSAYLEDLHEAGFVQRDYTWYLKTNTLSKLSHYHLSDNYLRFYLKYIEPLKVQIERGPVSLPSWEGIMGLQFENLILNNCIALHEQLEVRTEDVIMEGPYFQTRTNTHTGCQIDNLIQTRFGTLYVGEVKFSKNSIGMDIIEEMKKKISALDVSNDMSIRPILIHVNGITKDLEESRYFTHIINFSELLY